MAIFQVQDQTKLSDNFNFPGLAEKIGESGYSIYQEGPTWFTDNPVAVQAFIDSYNPLPYLKTVTRQAIKADGLARMKLVYPVIVDADFADLIFDLWRSIVPASRAPVADFQKLLDIRLAMRNASTSVTAATTLAEVRAVTPAWPA